MKIVEEFQFAPTEPRRFEVTARTSNALILRDNDMGKVYRVDVDTEDWAKIIGWGDTEWWNFIYINQNRRNG